MATDHVVSARTIEQCRFELRILCRDCRDTLNKTIPMTGQELQDHWTQLTLTAALQAGRCSNGCRSTWSDCNINTDLIIYDVETAHPVVLQALQFLAGHFYQDDHTRVCCCAEQLGEECYRSEHYPAVHGRCGRWLEPYSPVQR